MAVPLFLMLAANLTVETAADEIVRTELAFAADTAARGPAHSFRSFVAPDAVGLLPNPETKIIDRIDAKQRIDSRPLPPTPVPAKIQWWPAIVGVAGSGELGFTTGPVSFAKSGTYGFVFTVWVKQPDGRWKFFFDGGPKTDGPSEFRPGDAVRTIPSATARSTTPESAEVEVAKAEARIARRATVSLSTAYNPFLTTFTQLMGSGGQPTFGRRDAGKELTRRGRSIVFERLGSRAAKSGDLVFTYGRAIIDGTRQGGYTRIWQNSRRGWKIVLDQVQVP